MPNIFQNLLNRYRAADKAVGGWLPGGGAASPVTRGAQALGRAFTKPRQENAFQSGLRNLQELSAVSMVPQFMPVVQEQLNRAMGALERSTHVPQEKIEQARQFVKAKLPGDIPLRYDVVQPGESPFFNTQTGDVGLKFSVGPGGTVTSSAPIALHEFGHALNFANYGNSPRQTLRSDLYGTRPNAGFVAGLSSARGASDNERSFWQAGLEGALGELTAPGARHTLAEEAAASQRAVGMAKELNLPAGRRMLTAAFGTYAAPIVGRGVTEGLIGEVGARATNYLANFIGDTFIDPLADKVRGSEYTPLEEKLRKYGYTEDKYRLRSSGLDSPIKIQAK